MKQIPVDLPLCSYNNLTLSVRYYDIQAQPNGMYSLNNKHFSPLTRRATLVLASCANIGLQTHVRLLKIDYQPQGR